MWHIQNFAVWQAISILQAVVMHEEYLHETKFHAAYYYQRKISWRQGCTKIFKRRYKKIYPWNELSVSEHMRYSTKFPAMDLPWQANLVFHEYSMSHGWMDGYNQNHSVSGMNLDKVCCCHVPKFCLLHASTVLIKNSLSLFQKDNSGMNSKINEVILNIYFPHLIHSNYSRPMGKKSVYCFLIYRNYLRKNCKGQTCPHEWVRTWS